MDSNARREELALEREKMNKKFAMDVLGHIPEGHGQALRFAEIAECTINPSLVGLDCLLADSRIIDAEVVDGDSVDKGSSPTMRRIGLRINQSQRKIAQDNFWIITGSEVSLRSLAGFCR